MTTRRVAIIFWDGFFTVAPALVAALNTLADAGYEVTVLLHAPLDSVVYAPAPEFAQSVKIHQCRTILHWSEKLRRRLPGRAYTLFFLIALLHFILYCLFKIGLRRYRAFIGVEPNALLAATIAGRLKKTPVIYWSFELRLITRQDGDRFQQTMRLMEQRLSCAAQYTITQDQYRVDVMANMYGIPREKFILVPNGLGGASKAIKGVGTHKAFHKMFSLPDDTRVILQAGMISPAGLSLEIAQAAKNWPSDYSLVLHERRKLDKGNPYLKQIVEAGQGRVYLSLKPVPTSELDELVSSGDVGLVIYSGPVGQDMVLLTGASGKLAQYMRCGLPIIGLEMPGLRELIDRYQCGVCITDVSEIAPALDLIFGDYERYSANALHCFEQEYEFDKFFARVLTVIEADTR